jgi:hypothetical protein
MRGNVHIAWQYLEYPGTSRTSSKVSASYIILSVRFFMAVIINGAKLQKEVILIYTVYENGLPNNA